MKTTFEVTAENSRKRHLALTGRKAWALAELVKAGADGCTPITHPGPRWSAYVHGLRHEYQLKIDTVHEKHSGPFPGCHARYVLRSDVQVAESN